MAGRVGSRGRERTEHVFVAVTRAHGEKRGAAIDIQRTGILVWN